MQPNQYQYSAKQFHLFLAMTVANDKFCQKWLLLLVWIHKMHRIGTTHMQSLEIAHPDSNVILVNLAHLLITSECFAVVMTKHSMTNIYE